MFGWLGSKKQKAPMLVPPPVIDDGRVEMRIYCQGTDKYVAQWFDVHSQDWHTIKDYSVKPLRYTHHNYYPDIVHPSIEQAEKAARKYADEFHAKWLEKKKVGVVKELGRLP